MSTGRTDTYYLVDAWLSHKDSWKGYKKEEFVALTRMVMEQFEKDFCINFPSDNMTIVRVDENFDRKVALLQIYRDMKAELEKAQEN